MRVLVTGAAGFIGSHLCDRLVADGCEVIALDNGVTGRWENLGIATPLPAGHLVETSRAHLWAINAPVEEGQFWCFPEPDVIVHLAGHVGVDHVTRARGAMLREVGAVWELLDYAQQVGARLLLTSTSEIYGTSPSPLAEGQPARVHGPEIARASYAVAKLYLEHAAMAAHEEDKLRVTILRPFNVAGPRQRPDNVIARWLHAAAAGEPLIVHGGGHYRRAFLHVADFVEAVWQLMRCEAAIGQVVNIGADASAITLGTLAALVSRVAAQHGHVARTEVVRPGSLDPRNGWDLFPTRLPDLTRLHALLPKWMPVCGIEDIVNDAARWAYGRQAG